MSGITTPYTGFQGPQYEIQGSMGHEMTISSSKAQFNNNFVKIGKIGSFAGAICGSILFTAIIAGTGIHYLINKQNK